MKCFICDSDIINKAYIYKCIQCNNWWCKKCQSKLTTRGLCKICNCPFCRKKYYSKYKILLTSKKKQLWINKIRYIENK